MSSTVRPVPSRVVNIDWGDDERRLTPAVSVLVGDANGAYPSGNSVLVRGRSEAVVIDPSVTVVARGGVPAPVDAVVNSHSHEDHMAGNGLFPDARVHIHDEDLPGARSLEGLMDVYGLPLDHPFATDIVETVPLRAAARRHRASATGTCSTSAARRSRPCTCPATPAATAGSGWTARCSSSPTSTSPASARTTATCGAISRTSRQSLAKVREEDARYYVTFHHRGVIEGREEFVRLVDAFAAVIARRHGEMLEFLAEPHTIEEMAEHRFIYRPHVEMSFLDAVERRSAELHVQRMLRRGEAVEVEPGRYQAGTQ